MRIVVNEELHVTQCKSCGVWFAYPVGMHVAARQSGGFISCPSGHQWGWDKSNTDPDYKYPRQSSTIVVKGTSGLNELSADISSLNSATGALEKRLRQVQEALQQPMPIPHGRSKPKRNKTGITECPHCGKSLSMMRSPRGHIAKCPKNQRTAGKLGVDEVKK